MLKRKKKKPQQNSQNVVIEDMILIRKIGDFSLHWSKNCVSFVVIGIDRYYWIY